jgi:hypothetical protein
MLGLTARGLTVAGLLLIFQSPSIRLDHGRNLFILENWPGAATTPATRAGQIFTVSVDAPNVPDLLGKYRIEGGAVLFAPQFPLQPGMSYKAVARIPGSATLTKVFTTPKADLTPTTGVQHVYPSTNVLPENQLKFYIHFSSPMARGFAYDNISLIDQSGARVKAPFLELGEELWDPSGRRFTLFFDPGRIKRGLLSQKELGLALYEGKRYTLVVGKAWKDAEGRPLTAEFRKSFTVGPPDRKPVDLKSWTVTRPLAGGRGVLRVAFPEVMDHAIAQRELEVVTSTGAVIKGAVSIGPDEKSWSFTPDVAWKKGAYAIRVGTALADLAGNMIDREFDIDVFERTDQNLNRSTRTIEFQVN